MRICFLICLCASLCYGSVVHNGLIETTESNQALLVGVERGLPGISEDLVVMAEVASHFAFNYKVSLLFDKSAAEITLKLTELAAAASGDGTFLFYFSGHGNKGAILAQDRLLTINEIRTAIMAGRQNLGPLARLVLIFDSCHSGSLLDPVDIPSFPTPIDLFNSLLPEGTFTGTDSFWKRLIVLASSRADETSIASIDGSEFTLAFSRAFGETSSDGGTVGDLISRTKAYTSHHHPIERLVPETLTLEQLH